MFLFRWLCWRGCCCFERDYNGCEVQQCNACEMKGKNSMDAHTNALLALWGLAYKECFDYGCCLLALDTACCACCCSIIACPCVSWFMIADYLKNGPPPKQVMHAPECQVIPPIERIEFIEKQNVMLNDKVNFLAQRIDGKDMTEMDLYT